MMFKSKQKVSPNYEVDPSIERRNVTYKKEAEELFGKIVDMAFVTSSPITGEPIDAVRTCDVCRIIFDFFGVDPDSTNFAHYK